MGNTLDSTLTLTEIMASKKVGHAKLKEILRVSGVKPASAVHRGERYSSEDVEKAIQMYNGFQHLQMMFKATKFPIFSREDVVNSSISHIPLIGDFGGVVFFIKDGEISAHTCASWIVEAASVWPSMMPDSIALLKIDAKDADTFEKVCNHTMNIVDSWDS